MCNCINSCYESSDACHKKNLCFYFYGYALFTSLLFIFYYYYIYDSSSFIHINFLNGIMKDLEKTPIFDIILKENYDTPNGYKKIIFWEYKGTDMGCKCTNESYDIVKIEKGACTEELKRLWYCREFSFYDEDLDKYRNKIFYVKRDNLETFQKYLIVKEHQKCPKGKKQCGILDSLGNILCLNENQNCPINDIIINAKKEMKGYKSLELNKGKFIHFTNKFPNKFIISDLSVFFQEPCIYPQDNFWDNFIQLENREGVPGCKKSNGIDKRYQYLNDSYNLSLFYQENYILSKYEYEFLIPEKKEHFLILI